MTRHICDKCNVNNAAIVDLQFYTFYNLIVLNILIRGIVLPRLMYWCLHTFVFEMP